MEERIDMVELFLREYKGAWLLLGEGLGDNRRSYISGAYSTKSCLISL